jgi:exodeoxyribonuclease VII large subunit
MQLNLPDAVRTVSQLTIDIKLMLESQYRFVAVSGEISNLKIPFSGHHYFTLKDSGAQLRAVMFKGQQRYLAEPLRDGQQVICRGRISVYEPRGDYQLIVDTIDQHGIGMLQMKFAALKKKLADEGLFDASRKKSLPPFPARIVVISSATGAAVHDFLKICRQRNTNTTIQIFPVPVQGNAAPPAIVKAIQTVNNLIQCDAIVLCRGGGSLEDLWAFNEEAVARAIVNSKIPIITGVGHEIDTTIADLCADVRAPTPTGAAEILIPDTTRLKVQLQTAQIRLRRVIIQHLNISERSVTQQQRHLANFRSRVENLSLRTDLVIEKFQQSLLRLLKQREEELQQTVTRLQYQAPLNRIELRTQTVLHLRKQISQQMISILMQNENRLSKCAALLNGVSPLSILARGYSIVQKQNVISGEMQTVSKSNQVNYGDEVKIRLHEGALTCKVQDTE